MARGEAKVHELVEMIERGELRLPEMQRRYVWRATRVRDLLDSLYRGYPSGTILVWNTDEDVPLQNFAVAQQTSPFEGSRLLLDGQQRLTSLSAVIRGRPVTVRGRQKPIDILFNLEHPDGLAIVTEVEEDSDVDGDSQDDIDADSQEDALRERLEKMTFVVGTKKLASLKHWVSVTEVFQTNEDAPFLRRAGIRDFEDPRYAKFSQRLARLRGIRDYIYRLDVLERTLSYEEVTEIFVRVNSLGAKLRSSDLALAQITAKWRGSLQIFERYREKSCLAGFDLDLGIHLKNLVAFATGQSRFKSVGGISVERLQTAWREATRGWDFALNFLKSNVGIESPVLLASPFVMVALAYYGHHSRYRIDEREAQELRKWLLLANAKGRYSRGSSETLLDQDLATIREGGGVPVLLERLRSQVGRLDVSVEELEGRSQRSALFKTMFLAFRASGAQDWQSNLVIALHHEGPQDKLQFHHIFPKAILKGRHLQREVDDVANLAFIGGRTNRQISSQPPSGYLAKLIGKSDSALRAQCIPNDQRLFGIEAFPQFLQARRKMIATRLNEFLGVGVVAR